MSRNHLSLGLDLRCCGRKVIKYKRDGGPHYFCPRCDRAYSLDTREWIPNWAWLSNGTPRYPAHDYVNKPGPLPAESIKACEVR